MDDKKIYMNLDDTKDESKIKEFSKDKMQDEALEKLQNKMLDGVELVEVVGGMVNITMPLPMLQILSMFFKKLENQNTMENTRC